MGFLDDLSLLGRHAPEDARNLLKTILGGMPITQLARGEADVSPNKLAEALRAMPVFDKGDTTGLQEGMNWMTPMLAAKIVYHGSPHKFDKFDASKIGTGEGAQAYGHGVYLADAPDVAQSYTKGGGAFQKSSPVPNVMIGDKWAQTMPRDSLESQAATVFANDLFGATIPDKVKKLRSANMGPVADFLEKNADQFRLSNGEFYKADLPDEWIPKMLDWDKPLSQQSKEVQGAIKAVVPDIDRFGWVQGNKPVTDPEIVSRLEEMLKKRPAEVEAQGFRKANLFSEMSGKDIHYLLGGRAMGSSGMGEAALREAGIPGIRYLDGGSRPNSGRITMLEQTIANLQGRGASKAAIANAQRELDAELARASYNYVVFPGLEDKVKILERNGQPINVLAEILK